MTTKAHVALGSVRVPPDPEHLPHELRIASKISVPRPFRDDGDRRGAGDIVGRREHSPERAELYVLI